MKERELLRWPPKVGQRIHLDTGWAHNSWSGEARAVVDGEVAIIKRWMKHKGYHRYFILDRIEVQVFNRNERESACKFFVGPLPRRERERAG
jgi:hypothetical protein